MSPTVKGFTLQIDQENSKFKAGQWIDLFIPGVEMVGGFSMCGPPSRLEQENILDLAVKSSNWPPALWLHTHARAGGSVAVRIGGDFFYPCEDVNALGDHQILLIAGGVGINPLASIFFHIDDLLGEFNL